MTDCYLCLNHAISIIKVQFAHGIKTFIVCKEHMQGDAYQIMQAMAIEEISEIDDPKKFQSEITKIVQEIISS